MSDPKTSDSRVALTLVAVRATVFLAIIQGCSSSTEPHDLPEALVPLAVGNMWIERVTEYDAGGSVRTERLDTTVVRAKKQIDGDTWYQTHDPVWVANRAGGYWVSLDGIGSWLAAKYPAGVGDTFATSRVRVVSDSGTTRDYLRYATVAATDRRVSTPAGTFSCFEYRFTLTELDGSPILDRQIYYDDRFFVAPGVGYVRNERYERLESGKVFPGGTRELISFTLTR